MVKLPARFVVVFEGDLRRVSRRAVIVPNALPHLIDYLLSGREMPLNPFEAFGLRVSVEEDTDQADEPDAERGPPL